MVKEINKYWVHDWDDPGLKAHYPGPVQPYELMLPDGYKFGPFMAILDGYYFYRVLASKGNSVTMADKDSLRLIGKLIHWSWDHSMRGLG